MLLYKYLVPGPNGLMLSSNLRVYRVERTVCCCLPSINEYNSCSRKTYFNIILQSATLLYSGGSTRNFFFLNLCISSCLVYVESRNFRKVQKLPFINAYCEVSGDVHGRFDGRKSPNDFCYGYHQLSVLSRPFNFGFYCLILSSAVDTEL